MQILAVEVKKKSLSAVLGGCDDGDGVQQRTRERKKRLPPHNTPLHAPTAAQLSPGFLIPF